MLAVEHLYFGDSPEALSVGIGEGGNTEPPVPRLIETVEGTEAELHAIELRSRQGGAIRLQGRSGCHEEAGVEDRRVDTLRLAGPSPVVQGLDDTDRREEPVTGVP